MRDYKLGFSGRFVEAADFGDAAPTVVVEAVNLEEIPDPETGVVRERWVIAFKGKKKPWVLNRTNAECLTAMFGRDVDGWIGKAVTLCSEQVRLGGKTVPGIRVKGSPMLEAPLTFELKLPRKKPKPYTLVPTGKAKDSATNEVKS